MKRFVFLAYFLGVVAAGAVGQASSYQENNLVSNVAGSAAHTDRTLVNPWGIALSAGGQFWIANNHSGFATTYDATGTPQIPLLIGIPGPTGAHTPGTPTGVISNSFAGDGDFKVAGVASQFLYATEPVSYFHVDGHVD